MPSEAQFDKLKQKPLVLISPLDWGWGHTTRCIPLIDELIKLNCSVLIACSQWQEDLLKPLFPDSSFLNLSGYNVKYGHSPFQTRLKLFFQIPRIQASIRREKRWLSQLLKTTSLAGIIADNRYGLYQPSIPCVLITHQLHIQSGSGRLTDNILQKINYRLLRRFSQCWVPDNPSIPNAAGELSHPSILPLTTTRYIGCLSRMKACPPSPEKGILILLSGPEPQRSILEKLLVAQLSDTTESVVLVRGTLSGSPLTGLPKTVSVFEHCNSDELNKLICNARLVIARSGYTTIMDLLKLTKKSILIPTPGQSEQVYLGNHLMQHQWAFTMNQKDFSLKAALKKADNFPYKTVDWNMEQYKSVLKQWVESLK